VIMVKKEENDDYDVEPEDDDSSPYDGELYDADPDCKHVIKAKWSGVSCSKCNGWFCY